MTPLRLRGGVVGVELVVRDLRRSREFLLDALGFAELGGSLVGNGVIRLRLVAGAASSSPVWIELETDDLRRDFATLAARDDVHVEPEQESHAVVEGMLVQRLLTPFGFGVVLRQELTEDDLDEPPPLPSTMEWEEPADRVLRRVLRDIPLSFREGARRRATERAETLALIEGRPRVTPDHMTRALFEVTPEFQHHGVRSALKKAADEPVKPPC